MRLLHAEGLACGETGASGVAGLLLRCASIARGDTWQRLGLGATPAALAICTEAPTDPESFARITALS